MNQKKLFQATFQCHSHDHINPCGPPRQLVIVADSLADAAKVAEQDREEGETIGLAEIATPVTFA